MAFTLTSNAFSDGGEIPIRHTKDGEDLSPPLSWANVPDGTKSLALVVEDPDAPDPAAPQRTWIHWIVYNLLYALDTVLPELDRPNRRKLDEAIQGHVIAMAELMGTYQH